MSLVEYTVWGSLFAQFATIIVDFYGLSIDLEPNDKILNSTLKLETFVQVIEGLFYVGLAIFFKNVHLENIASLRYLDWVFTTPTMLLSTIMFMEYNNLKSEGKTLGLKEFLVNHKNSIIRIVFMNFMMLLFGVLGELGIISRLWATLIGFVFFADVFSVMYFKYVKENKTNQKLFWFMCIIWGIYCIAYLFNDEYKNISYNILDIIAKNFYGVFLVYQIYLNKK